MQLTGFKLFSIVIANFGFDLLSHRMYRHTYYTCKTKVGMGHMCIKIIYYNNTNNINNINVNCEHFLESGWCRRLSW